MSLLMRWSQIIPSFFGGPAFMTLVHWNAAVCIRRLIPAKAGVKEHLHCPLPQTKHREVLVHTHSLCLTMNGYPEPQVLPTRRPFLLHTQHLSSSHLKPCPTQQWHLETPAQTLETALLFSRQWQETKWPPWGHFLAGSSTAELPWCSEPPCSAPALWSAPTPNPGRSLLPFIPCLVPSLPELSTPPVLLGKKPLSPQQQLRWRKVNKSIWLQGTGQAGAADPSNVPATTPQPGHCPGAGSCFQNVGLQLILQ